MKKTLTLTFLAMLVTFTAGFAQTSKFLGTWELLKPPGANADQTIGYAILRTFDKKGNYIQYAITGNGSFIASKARFEPVNGGKVKELFTFAADPSKIGKTFTFNYRFATDNNRELLITEGPTKIVNGYVTFEWREVWRKVEEYRAN